MKLSFLPGQLDLDSLQDGRYRVAVKGNEILRTRSKKAALSKFNELREQMEKLFPPRELTDGEKAEILRKMLGDALVQHNSLGGRKKKSTAGSTRTFGG